MLKSCEPGVNVDYVYDAAGQLTSITYSTFDHYRRRLALPV
jgi:hypothetical protein